MKPAISYLRISTQRQGESGLGERAQRSTVWEFCKRRGLELVDEYVEVESGRKCDRPELENALEEARQMGAVVVVAKLDRLARDTEFILRLLRESCENGMGGFRFCDFPEVDTKTPIGKMFITNMAAFAEFEAERGRERTKDALAAAKKNGTALGSAAPNYRGHATRQKKAREFARKWGPRIESRQLCANPMTHEEIAEDFNKKNAETPSGRGRWHKATVARVLKNWESAKDWEEAK